MTPEPISRRAATRTKGQNDDGSPNWHTHEWLDGGWTYQGRKELTRLKTSSLDSARYGRGWHRQGYRFDTEDGRHAMICSRPVAADRVPIMLRPGLERRLPECSGFADASTRRTCPPESRRSVHGHLACPAREVARVSRRMGWSLQWRRQCGRLQLRLNVAFTEESVATGQTYNFRPLEGGGRSGANCPMKGPGMSSFALTTAWCTHIRRVRAWRDALWKMWRARSSADRRNEGDLCVPRHDPVRSELPMTSHNSRRAFEEWISPLILSGAAYWIAARAALRRIVSARTN